MTDADIGLNSEVDFTLDPVSANLFNLVPTGSRSTELLVNHALNREAIDVYNIELYAIDRGTPSRIGETNITLIITVRISSA